MVGTLQASTLKLEHKEFETHWFPIDQKCLKSISFMVEENTPTLGWVFYVFMFWGFFFVTKKFCTIKFDDNLPLILSIINWEEEDAIQ